MTARQTSQSVMTIGIDDYVIREFTDSRVKEHFEYLGTATMTIRIDELKA